jgi:hypothetical protein
MKTLYFCAMIENKDRALKVAELLLKVKAVKHQFVMGFLSNSD